MKKNLIMVVATIFAIAGFSEAQAFMGCGCEPKPKKESCCNEFVPKRCEVKTCKRVSKCAKCGENVAAVAPRDEMAEDLDGEEVAEDVDGQGIVAPGQPTISNPSLRQGRAGMLDRGSSKSHVTVAPPSTTSEPTVTHAPPSTTAQKPMRVQPTRIYSQGK